MEPPREHHYHHFHHRANHPEQHPNYFQLQHQPQHHYFNRHDHFAEPNLNHQFNNHNFNVYSNFDANHQMMTGHPNEPFGRKRGRFHSGRVGSPDHNVDADYVKLFVAPVPAPTTIENISSLFEAHGNVVEVIFPRDKLSGQRHGYCFVKYATIEEAERAIMALHSKYTIPGEVHPLKVKYADKGRERTANIERECFEGGELVDKLYVGCINKQASRQEIEEIFSPYGHVEDVYIVRDVLKQSRGCAFVKLPHRDMALAAIKALHGTFTMKGCDQPLIVKFADPKKRRVGELRGNCAFGGQNFDPCSQEPIIRPVPSFGDSMGGRVLHNNSYHMQETRTISQPLAVPNTINLVHTAQQTVTKSLSPVNQPPTQLYQMPLQQTQDLQQQSSQQTVSEMMKQTQNSEQQQSIWIPMELPCNEGNPPSINDTSSAPAVCPSSLTEDPPECDWSEHRCPDGYKYYFNCSTFESRWEKPDEFILHQQKLLQQRDTWNPSQQPYSLPIGSSVEEADHASSISNSTSSSLPVDTNHLQMQSETRPVVDPTCV